MVVTHADDGVFSVYGYSAVLPHTLKKYVKLYTSALASKTVYLRQSGNQHSVHISATKCSEATSGSHSNKYSAMPRAST